MSQPPSDPEETAPFTHRPYGGGDGGNENPYTSPSGPASEPSGPSYSTPPPTAPAYSSPYVPYQPVYGAPLPGSASQKNATTAMVLGIVSLVSVVLTPFCCITLPGLFCAPFAWWLGAKAKREIAAQPGVFNNASTAQAGFVMGIIGTVLSVLLIAAFVGVAVWVGVTDYSLV